MTTLLLQTPAPKSSHGITWCTSHVPKLHARHDAMRPARPAGCWRMRKRRCGRGPFDAEQHFGLLDDLPPAEPQQARAQKLQAADARLAHFETPRAAAVHRAHSQRPCVICLCALVRVRVASHVGLGGASAIRHGRHTRDESTGLIAYRRDREDEVTKKEREPRGVAVARETEELQQCQPQWTHACYESTRTRFSTAPRRAHEWIWRAFMPAATPTARL